ncbi:MAG TPA: acyltransferase [Thermoleophilaceae bacterium]|jgi:acetyltransferase-like isoleucine patch superfamily enzyme
MAASPNNDAPYRMIRDVDFGEGVIVRSFTNLYGCRIGDFSQIGAFVEIQAGAEVGRRCKIQSHTFVCDGVHIGDETFVGHGVMFINDKTPRVLNDAGEFQSDDDWELMPVTVGRHVAIGSGAVILGGVKIGDGAVVGAGAVVSRDVADGTTVRGVPARLA